VIVVAGYALMGGSNGTSLGALRMLRLVRLFTFIKGVKQLRVIVTGLLVGLKSVTYIVMLLFLVIFICAILACLFMGKNDPARFGTVAMAMLSLFQVSTLASWTSIAYTTWYGCENYLGDPYGAGGAENPSMIRTAVGDFQGYKCGVNEPRVVFAFIFFSLFIVLTAWVIMSLFIGVITMGMFEAFEEMKNEIKQERFQAKAEENIRTAAMASGAISGDNSFIAAAKRSGSFTGLTVDMADTDPPKKTPKASKRALGAKGGEEPSSPLVRPVAGSGGGGTYLADLILKALADDAPEEPARTVWEARFRCVARVCARWKEASWFNNAVTVTIVAVGVMIGVETDSFMACERWTVNRGPDSGRNSAAGSGLETEEPAPCEATSLSVAMGVGSQVVFTLECAVKLLSYEYETQKFFHDGWNCMDFFIVLTGFIEMTPAAIIFKMFPVVILRLLRLLRVFRLAKALPRLRSIVEALMHGFSAVGWICVLIVVFNYIIACACMLLLKANDPFHFGTIPRAMFNVLRIETLDTWDQILYITMFGCDQYPAGYDFTVSAEGGLLRCENPYASGWVGAFFLLFIVIFGSYVLPTVLIGIVAISFEEATRHSANLQEMMEKMALVMVETEAKMPGYFTPDRIAKLREVFSEMDADNELSLDMNEMIPFYKLSFALLFEVDLADEHMEAIFYLMDTDGSTDLGFGEFVLFVVAIKQIEKQCVEEPGYADRIFGGTPNKYSDWAAFQAVNGNPAAGAKAAADQPPLAQQVRTSCEACARKALPPFCETKAPNQFNACVEELYSLVAAELVREAAAGVRTASAASAAAQQQLGSPDANKGGAKSWETGKVGEVIVRAHRQESLDAVVLEAARPERERQQRAAALALEGGGGGAGKKTNQTSAVAWRRVLGFLQDPDKARTVEEMFESLDEDSSGCLDTEELVVMLRKLGVSGLSDEEMAKFTRDLDLNGDGLITLEEFSDAVGERSVGLKNSQTELWLELVKLVDKSIKGVEFVFQQLDKNKDGKCSLDELGEALVALGADLGRDKVELFRDAVDTNGDGMVSFSEFLQGVEANRALLEAKSLVKAPTKLDRMARGLESVFASNPLKTVTTALTGESKLSMKELLLTAWQKVVEQLEGDLRVAQKLEEKFEAADEDGNARLDIGELAVCLTENGIHLTADELNAFRNDLDTNRDGNVTFEEFVSAVERNRMKAKARAKALISKNLGAMASSGALGQV